MMPDNLHAGLLFLINTIFDLYLFVLVLRVLLVWVGANYFDPVTQFVVKLTDVFVKPLRRVIPNVKNIELSTVVLILGIGMLKFLLISLLSLGMPTILALILLSIGNTIKVTLNVLFYAILLQAILSWVQPYATVNRLLYQITQPFMKPFKRYIPPVGGFDISPIPALITLQLLIMIVAEPIMMAGWSNAFGTVIRMS